MKSNTLITTSIIALLIIALVVGAAYWWQSSRSDNGQQNQSPTPTPTTQLSTPTPTPNQPTPSGQSNVGICSGQSLSVEVAPTSGGAAAGSVEYTITLTNDSQQSCQLYGYPGVVILNQSNQDVGNPADRDETRSPEVVRLSPSDSATADLHVVRNYFDDPNTCQSGGTKLQVIPPNTTDKLTAPIEPDWPLSTWCPGFSVRPIRPAS